MATDYLRRFFAGAVFGLYMAHLLFFLNPQIEVSALRLTATALIYALIAGAIFGSALWLLHRMRLGLKLRRGSQPEGGPGSGAGFASLAAAVAAAVYWGHVFLLRVYLPREAVRNLSKASVIVAAAALLLLLLWIADRTAPRRFWRVIFAGSLAVVILSSLSLHIRRYRYRPEHLLAGRAMVERLQPRRVIFVAVRNLPFDWIVQLAGEGLLPFFLRAREEAFLTRLEPFPTTSANALWASLATGKLPHGHGVTGRFSYRMPLIRAHERLLLVPYWVGFKAWGLLPPVKRISAQLPAGDALPLWSLFENGGHEVMVVSWTGGKRQRFSGDAAVRLAVSTEKAVLVVLSLDELGGQGIPGNQLPPGSTPSGELIRRQAEKIDELLSRIVKSVPDATLVVASPSGPVPPALPGTPLELIETWFRQEQPGSSDGFLLIRGPSTVSRANAAPVAIVDVVPTVLFAAGLPVARDMDGRAVAEAFSEGFVRQNPMSLIATYEAPHR